MPMVKKKQFQFLFSLRGCYYNFAVNTMTKLAQSHPSHRNGIPECRNYCVHVVQTLERGKCESTDTHCVYRGCVCLTQWQVQRVMYSSVHRHVYCRGIADQKTAEISRQWFCVWENFCAVLEHESVCFCLCYQQHDLEEPVHLYVFANFVLYWIWIELFVFYYLFVSS